MNDVDVLKNALALIENPEHWTQTAYARDNRGLSTIPESQEAQSWCLIGAISRCTEDLRQRHNLIGFIDSVLRQRWVHIPDHLDEPGEFQLVSFYNDTFSHEDVLLVLKDVIQHRETAQ